MSLNLEKEKAAKEAFQLIEPDLRKDSVIGIGTGSTTNFFIDELNKAKILLFHQQDFLIQPKKKILCQKGNLYFPIWVYLVFQLESL